MKLKFRPKVIPKNLFFAVFSFYRTFFGASLGSVLFASICFLAVPINLAVAAKGSKGDSKASRNAQQNTQATAEYHFTMAQAYSADGDTDRAIEEYKLTLMFDPSSSLVFTRLATEYVRKGMFSSAMEAAKEALKLDPNYLDARMILAGLYSTTHEAHAAVAEYDQVLKMDPKHEEAAVYRSQVLIEDGKVQQAVTGLKGFLKTNADSTLVWYYLGRAEQQLDHVSEAATAYRRAMENHFVQAGLALGFLYEEKRMNKEAISVYKKIFEDSQDIAAAGRLSTILLKEEKYADAVPYLKAIIASDAEDLNARVKLGLVQMEMKKYDEAVITFKALLEKNPDSDRIHYYLGSLYEETKKVKEAIAELSLIKPDSKLYPDAILHAAFLMKQTGDMPSAREMMRTALSAAPNNVSLYLFSASLEEEVKNVKAAIHVLEAGVKLFPEDEKLHYYLGSLYDRNGDVDRGLAQMESILKVNPTNVDALNYIGYTWTQKGIRLDDAENYLRRAMGLRPENAYIQDSWGWYLYVRGRMKQAVVELEKAVKLKPNEPTILEHLGDAYLRSNLREKALNRYKEAVKYTEDVDSKRKIQTKADHLTSEIAQSKTGIKTGPTGVPSQGFERLPASRGAVADEKDDEDESSQRPGRSRSSQSPSED